MTIDLRREDGSDVHRNAPGSMLSLAVGPLVLIREVFKKMARLNRSDLRELSAPQVERQCRHVSAPLLHEPTGHEIITERFQFLHGQQDRLFGVPMEFGHKVGQQSEGVAAKGAEKPADRKVVRFRKSDQLPPILAMPVQMAAAAALCALARLGKAFLLETAEIIVNSLFEGTQRKILPRLGFRNGTRLTGIKDIPLTTKEKTTATATTTTLHITGVST